MVQVPGKLVILSTTQLLLVGFHRNAFGLEVLVLSIGFWYIQTTRCTLQSDLPMFLAACNPTVSRYSTVPVSTRKAQLEPT
jgi:hypothetical protein